eukprot:8592139-Lingulodinium_polyedra.AAC.1
MQGLNLLYHVWAAIAANSRRRRGPLSLCELGQSHPDDPLAGEGDCTEAQGEACCEGHPRPTLAALISYAAAEN